jgi:hypothetical protein
VAGLVLVCVCVCVCVCVVEVLVKSVCVKSQIITIGQYGVRGEEPSAGPAKSDSPFVGQATVSLISKLVQYGVMSAVQDESETKRSPSRMVEDGSAPLGKVGSICYS